jgi:hypothetical protein
MGLRYNPPPGWPPAPDGFTPEPGWTPDPSWPPAPPGWQLWVDDGQPADPPWSQEATRYASPGSPATPYASPGSPAGSASPYADPGTPAAPYAGPGSPATPYASPGNPASPYASPGSPASPYAGPGTPYASPGSPGTPYAGPGSPATPYASPGSPGTPYASPGTPATPYASPGNPGTPYASPGSPASPYASPGSPASPYASPGSPASPYASPGSGAPYPGTASSPGPGPYPGPGSPYGGGSSYGAYGGPAGPYGGYGPAGTGTSGLAIASLVLGFLGGLLITGIAGIVFGIAALNSIRRTGQRGKGMAIAGIVLSGAWIALVVTLIVIGSLGQATQGPNGQISKGGSLSVFSLKVGDCFDAPSSQTDITSVTAVPCGQAHNAQVYAQFKVSGSDSSYPGNLRQVSRQGCNARQGNIDQSKVTGSMFITFLFPEQSSWVNGNRTVNCVIDDPAKDLTSSMLKG